MISLISILNESFIEAIPSIFVVILSLFIHEIGHCVAYRIFGLKPSIDFSFKPLGLIMIGKNIFYLLLPMRKFIITIAGILIGFTPFLLTKTGGWWLIAYFMGCTGDIMILYKLIFRIPFNPPNVP